MKISLENIIKKSSDQFIKLYDNISSQVQIYNAEIEKVNKIEKKFKQYESMLKNIDNPDRTLKDLMLKTHEELENAKINAELEHKKLKKYQENRKNDQRLHSESTEKLKDIEEKIKNSRMAAFPAHESKENMDVIKKEIS